MNWFEPALRWYLVLAALTWAFAPGVQWLCQPLADRGVTITRPIAMVAAVYPVWLLASLRLVPFDSRAVVGVVVIAAALGWVFTLRQRNSERSWMRSLLVTEIASLVFFATYLWLRGYTPQILGTEKPMDIAFLASNTRAVTMPPPDPWFAGEPINYYYLGYLLHGSLGRLAQVSPETGFNLALATVFSMTTVSAFGVAWNVVRPSLGPGVATASGLFALFAVAISGNLYAPLRLLLQNGQSTVSAWWWDSIEGIGWRSSRIVCDGPRIDNLCSSPATETINEFPFFSFLLGDLHPHVMALPFTVVVVGLAWNLALKSQERIRTLERARLLRIAITGSIVGSLYALNAWDFPTYLLLTGFALYIAVGASIRVGWKPIGLLLAAAIAAWSPFIASYVPPTVAEPDTMPALIERLPIVPRLVAAVGLHLGERTSLGEYLTVFGTQYAFGIALVIAGIHGWNAKANGFVRTLVMSSVATVVPGLLLSAPVIPLCGIPLAFAIAQLREMRSVGLRWFALTLFSLAWILSIGVEIVYVRDVFEDRMNTLFKFYYQSWTLYG
ncbi:MAG TPA: DUF2298 domain-containing protein, partial [Thermomicrobiales bacterium]|nr:DUF2298 domain-containing protein [Thermomicrobiales bacterium]